MEIITQSVYQFGSTMSKKAEQAAKEIYKDGIELFGHRDKHGNLIIHPETMVGILRNACQRGYEKAEKDTVERACEWLSRHYDIDLVRFRKAIEEEQ